MEGLLGSSIDEKNIELAKTLFCLRQDMDVYCLIGVNASKIEANAIGTLFFGHVQASYTRMRSETTLIQSRGS